MKLQQRLYIEELIPSLGSKLKGGQLLKTHLRWKNVCYVPHHESQMIGKLLVPYTFRHRYAKAYHASDIQLTNISTEISHTKEVDHQRYATFIHDGKCDTHAKRNAMIA